MSPDSSHARSQIEMINFLRLFVEKIAKSYPRYLKISKIISPFHIYEMATSIYDSAWNDWSATENMIWRISTDTICIVVRPFSQVFRDVFQYVTQFTPTEVVPIQWDRGVSACDINTVSWVPLQNTEIISEHSSSGGVCVAGLVLNVNGPEKLTYSQAF